MGRFGSGAVVGAALLAGCYAPNAATGAPCGPELECPSGQSCDTGAAGGPTCVLPNQTAAPDASEAPPGDSEGDDGMMTIGVDGSIPGPTNDLAADAIDVSAGGTFTWDPTYARDDFTSPCAAGAGPDVFFTITLPAPEVIYLDTFGSTANGVIAVHAGACTAIGAAEACVDDSCGGTDAQGAWSLGAGAHCIVVDQVGASGGAAGTLEVIRGNRAGDALPGASGSVTGNTCGDDNSNNAGCGNEPTEDHHYFFTACPGVTSATIETCDAADWDTVLQLRSNANASLGCDDDTCEGVRERLTRDVTGPGLFWGIIDGYEECGAYTLTYSFQ